MKALPVLAITVVQSLICLAHWFMYRTWIDFWWPLSPTAQSALAIAFALLSVIFMAATLLGFRFSNPFVKSSLLGSGDLDRFCQLPLDRGNPRAVDRPAHCSFSPLPNASLPGRTSPLILLVAAIATGIYGLVNARVIRERRISVRLPDLPPSWRGRTALLISDLHLGHINRHPIRASHRGHGSTPRSRHYLSSPATSMMAPKSIPILLRSPLFELSPPFGIYFVDGNHEGFGGATSYEEALIRAGIRVLNNERVSVDGLQIIGVPYGPSTYPWPCALILKACGLKTAPPAFS